MAGGAKSKATKVIRSLIEQDGEEMPKQCVEVMRGGEAMLEGREARSIERHGPWHGHRKHR